MRGLPWALAALTTLALCSGCGGAEQPAAQPPPPPAAPPPPAVPRLTELPKECGPLLQADVVEKELERRIGPATSVLRLPEPKLGRIARLDCYYGAAPRQPNTPVLAPVMISATVYADEPAAGRRVRLTIEQERASGATSGEITVGQDRATLLTTAKDRTLVLLAGRSTLALTLVNGTVPDDKIVPGLTRMAAVLAAKVPR